MRDMGKLLGFLVVAGLIWVIVAAPKDRPATAPAPQTRQATVIPQLPSDKMSVVALKWKLGGFGSIAIMDLTIENRNEYTVKDIRISCDYSGKSGTTVSSASKTIFDTIKPNEKKAFREINMGFVSEQSARGGCQIIGASRA